MHKKKEKGNVPAVSGEIIQGLSGKRAFPSDDCSLIIHLQIRTKNSFCHKNTKIRNQKSINALPLIVIKRSNINRKCLNFFQIIKCYFFTFMNKRLLLTNLYPYKKKCNYKKMQKKLLNHKIATIS